MGVFDRHKKPDFLTVERFYEDFHSEYDLSRCAGSAVLRGSILSPVVHRPGLALAGFTAKYPFKSIQIIGEIEREYLKSRSSPARRIAWGGVLIQGVPMVVFSDGCRPDKIAADCASGKKVPLFSTRLSSEKFCDLAGSYIKNFYSPGTFVHGTLVEIYGVGMLYVGVSGIGKSECALDLISRGHMLVSDDIVNITCKNDQLIGTTNLLLRHHMEIRGVGIVDIERLCGIRSIRSEGKIDVQVELVPWNSEENYERTGINESTVEILGVSIPRMVIPISPGKNISAISELIALNIIARKNGTNSALEFDKKLISSMKLKNHPQEYRG